MNIDIKGSGNYLEEFLLYKHNLGYVYDTQAICLRKYVEFEEAFYPGSIMTKEAVDAFLSSIKDTPGQLFNVTCTLREFSRYLIKKGLNVYIPREKIAKQPTPEPPYFFTDREIEGFFHEIDNIEPAGDFKGREWIIPALFRIMYCCGTRCKEVRLLRCNDVVFDMNYIDIRQSKGHKDRRLFIHSDLSEYLREYDRKITPLYPKREYFFPGYRGTPCLAKAFVSNNFRRYWAKAYPDFSGEIIPSAYDFRHHFAYTNINRWTANGIDVNAMLPYLMRYMGHLSIQHTLYYFHFVPDFYPTYRQISESSESIIPEVPA